MGLSCNSYIQHSLSLSLCLSVDQEANNTLGMVFIGLCGSFVHNNEEIYLFSADEVQEGCTHTHTQTPSINQTWQWNTIYSCLILSFPNPNLQGDFNLWSVCPLVF